MDTRLDITSERGTTLIELMVVMIAGLVVFAAVGTVLTIALTQTNRQTDRVASLDEQRVAFDRMTRELRQAERAVLTGQTLAIRLPAPGGTRDVTWACGSGSCTRTDVATGSTQTLVENLVNQQPFAQAGPGMLEIGLEIQPDERFRPVTLSGGVSFRNCSPSSATAPAVLLNPC